MQSPAPLTVLGLVALATTAIVCGDTAGKLLTGAGVQPLFVAWCRVALNSGHPQFVWCRGSIRALSKFGPARPYIARFKVFNRLIWPSA